MKNRGVSLKVGIWCGSAVWWKERWERWAVIEYLVQIVIHDPETVAPLHW